MSVVDRRPESAVPDWSALRDALSASYPGVKPDEIADHILSAYEGIHLFGLPAGEELAMVELVARQQLKQRTGEISTTARLDPETHARARKPTA